jgi:N-methylhydantoinase A
MAAASKIYAVDKGKDVRRYPLLAFGGAGPIHARDVAQRIGCSEVLVPANAGVFSAQGLLVSPLKLDLVRTRYGRLEEIDWSEIEAIFAEMEATLGRELLSSGVTPSLVRFRRSADARYVGQGFEVTTEVPASLTPASTPEVTELFQAAYARRFEHHLHTQPIEVLNWRVQALAQAEIPDIAPIRNGRARIAKPRSRRAFFPDVNRFMETQVIHQRELAAGDWRAGPALIEQEGSTVVVGPSDRFAMDKLGNIRIELDTSQVKR